MDTTKRAEDVLSANPQVRYFNGRRGYVRCEVTAKAWKTDYRVLPYVTKPGAPIATHTSFTIEPGRLVLEKS